MWYVQYVQLVYKRSLPISYAKVANFLRKVSGIYKKKNQSLLYVYEKISALRSWLCQQETNIQSYNIMILWWIMADHSKKEIGESSNKPFINPLNSFVNNIPADHLYKYKTIYYFSFHFMNCYAFTEWQYCTLLELAFILSWE